MRQENCCTCRFWDPGNSTRGLCRRNAPRAHMGPIGSEVAVQALWPETAAGDWCGQHAVAGDHSIPVYAMRGASDPPPASVG